MSKTFTSRPAVTQGRGRGRGTAAQTQTNTRTTQGNTTGAAARPRMYGTGGPAGGGRGLGPGAAGYGTGGMARGAAAGYNTGGAATRYNNPGAMDLEEPSVDRPPAQVLLEQRASHEGSYVKVTPNEKKRREIQQMAQKEEAAYKSYKQQNTPTRVDYVGTAGGGQLKESEVRKKSQQELSKYQRLERKQQLNANKKSAEQAEIDKRKAEQRKKAEMNEQRRKEEEENGAHKWDEQRRRTNEAFLRRLERQSKKPPGTGQTSTANKSPENQPPRYQPGSVPMRDVRPSRTDDSGSDSAEPLSSTLQRTSMSSSQTETTPPPARPSLGASGGAITDEMQKKVIALQAIFPQYSETELREILVQLNGSLDEAVAVLQD